ncbi:MULTISPECIES: electron transfer flavoprotein subunit alpha/FixB family protein [Nocardiopsis]|uniref:Electron transfer flavoprotein alpha subunit n=1 Tax=Nocardiopsis dassonvillei (strain ATCC 23218 / DSM 43111 / CIP 107115 / JCM 7437 / KCTC 9190 / NBRC 14626 / NCTC 10488 / NRRL B-5397 / IMRU 509) TaxID=446468 RepID=D7AUE8_NOCDD|nr:MULTISPECIES: electron transfer flavoprotein subunit alpha/FixB family protein [Nocardiopsis]ADH65706.1 Electron transfer flavoprotein alpha subunit [Nocardiopsis dassonvillei subsp. dassonvillei DSM 43111]APC34056.1 electron transfer flavoprotein subunit alpha [Nocardiopsis dassonvillei]NKY80379.1 electron transfer flavoprotein subunit alpha/FixB family protein [Nocardiopsis dassonvillei]VEI91726.1 Electron transfer flavoprotein large subunit [Nocardiopsis dassonvillei]
MAEVLVLVDHVDGQVKKVTTELLTAARRIGEPAAVWIGDGAETGRGTLAEYGAEKVYVASAELNDHVVAPKAELLAKLAQDKGAAAVLVSATAENKEIAGRTAVKLGSGVLTDVVDVNAEVVAEHSIFGGTTITHARVRTGVPVVAVRPNSVPAEAASGAAAEEQVSVEVSDAAKTAKVVERVHEEQGERPELTEAAIVVSGGRGVGSDDFSVVENLADSLGAAVGASRAAVDSGWYPNQFQVGQTGKTVSPNLYVALGISGAIQHRAGMQTAKNIVAINKDPEAPIFELADFGVVGDLHAVTPQLTEEINKRK